MALGGKRHALMHAEAMLLVDHGQREVGELDIFLHQRMRADHEMDRAVGQAAQRLLLLLLAVAAGEQRQAHAGRLGERRDGGVVLAGQKLGRRHEGRLRAGLDADQHGEEGDHRLAAADIALQQADHALGLGHVGFDLADRGLLARRQVERQRAERRGAQPAVALRGVARHAAVVMTDQGDGELAGQQLVEGKARAGRMHRARGRSPRPARGRGRARTSSRSSDCARGYAASCHSGSSGARSTAAAIAFWIGRWRQAGGQAIDRLDPQDRLALVERHDMVGVRHLHLALVDLDLAAHHPDLAHGQELLQVVLAAVEVGEAEPAGLVAAPDAIGLARIARHQVLVDGHGERGDLARLGVRDLGRIAAVDDGEGQVPAAGRRPAGPQVSPRACPTAARFRAAMSLGRTGA